MLKVIAKENPYFYFVYDLVGKIPEDVEDFIRHLLGELEKAKQAGYVYETDIPKINDRVKAVYEAKKIFARHAESNKQRSEGNIENVPAC